MFKIFVLCLFVYIKLAFVANKAREEKLQQLINREDIKVTEVERSTKT